MVKARRDYNERKHNTSMKYLIFLAALPLLAEDKPPVVPPAHVAEYQDAVDAQARHRRALALLDQIEQDVDRVYKAKAQVVADCGDKHEAIGDGRGGIMCVAKPEPSKKPEK